MSNHSGSYMLNEFLHRLAEMGILKDISAAQKRSICDFLLSTSNDYDCNWEEIVDVEIAVTLETCAYCSRASTAISAETGYCDKCNQETQQAQIRSGEEYLLQELLTHRFGSLPYWVSQKMQNAPEEELLHWGERLLDNTLSLQEVFSSSG
jgi:hypothetical protein